MSNILCWVKYPKCKSSKEITWWQETSNWSKSETGCFCQKVGNVLELRDIVTWVTAVFFEKGKDVVEFATGTLFEQDSQFVVDFPPGGDLSWSVWHSRDSLMVSKKWWLIWSLCDLKWPKMTLVLKNLPIGECDISKFFSSSAVNFISESRMIRIKFRSVRQNLICESIKLGDMLLWVFNSFFNSQSEDKIQLTNEKWENIETGPEGTKEGYRLHHLES